MGGSKTKTDDQKDGVKFIADNLDIARKTVLGYKNSGECINPRLFMFLLDARFPKAYFEKLQQCRRRIDGFLKNRGYDEKRIDRIVHVMALQLWIDYRIFKNSDQKSWLEVNHADVVINHFNPNSKIADEGTDDVDSQNDNTSPLIETMICKDCCPSSVNVDHDSVDIDRDNVLKIIDENFEKCLEKINDSSGEQDDVMSILNDLILQVVNIYR